LQNGIRVISGLPRSGSTLLAALFPAATVICCAPHIPGCRSWVPHSIKRRLLPHETLSRGPAHALPAVG
jgi:hypothetical protein